MVLRSEIESLIDAESRAQGLDPALVRAVVKQESGFNPNARSPVGAQGLMQLMPATAASLGVKNPLNPRENVRGGTKYLSGLMKKYGNVEDALAHYNGGSGAVNFFKKRGGIKYNPNAKPGSWSRETAGHVRNIMAMMGRSANRGATIAPLQKKSEQGPLGRNIELSPMEDIVAGGVAPNENMFAYSATGSQGQIPILTPPGYFEQANLEGIKSVGLNPEDLKMPTALTTTQPTQQNGPLDLSKVTALENEYKALRRKPLRGGAAIGIGLLGALGGGLLGGGAGALMGATLPFMVNQNRRKYNLDVADQESEATKRLFDMINAQNTAQNEATRLDYAGRDLKIKEGLAPLELESKGLANQEAKQGLIPSEKEQLAVYLQQNPQEANKLFSGSIAKDIHIPPENIEPDDLIYQALVKKYGGDVIQAMPEYQKYLQGKQRKPQATEFSTLWERAGGDVDTYLGFKQKENAQGDVIKQGNVERDDNIAIVKEALSIAIQEYKDMDYEDSTPEEDAARSDKKREIEELKQELRGLQPGKKGTVSKQPKKRDGKAEAAAFLKKIGY